MTTDDLNARLKRIEKPYKDYFQPETNEGPQDRLLVLAPRHLGANKAHGTSDIQIRARFLLGIKHFPNSVGPALKFAGAGEEAREEKPISPALETENDRSLNGRCLVSGKARHGSRLARRCVTGAPTLAYNRGLWESGFESRSVHSETYGFPSSLLLRGHNSHMRRGTIIPHLFSGGRLFVSILSCSF